MTHKSTYILLLFVLFLTTQMFAQPRRDWATYYADDPTEVFSVAHDKNNKCFYIAGSTQSTTGIATTGTWSEIINQDGNTFYSDVFIAKFDESGTRLWGTYIGGDRGETGVDIALDPDGNLIIAGITHSETVKMVSSGTHQDSIYGSSVFVMKMDPTGEEIWSTYYGYGQDDTIGGFPVILGPGALNVCAGEDESIYLALSTSSGLGFATDGAYQEDIIAPSVSSFTEVSRLMDIVLARFDGDGNLLWGTYYGGSRMDLPYDIQVDQDKVYVVGSTHSIDLIGGGSGTYQPSIIMDAEETFTSGFLTVFDTSGSLIWDTYVSSDDNIHIASVTTDDDGNIYIYGSTSSDTLIATEGTIQEDLTGYSNAYLMKFTPEGARIWGTYFGGTMGGTSPYEGGTIMNYQKNTLHYHPASNDLYFGGSIVYTDGLATDCAYTPVIPDYKGFLARIDSSGQNVVWTSYIEECIKDLEIADDGNTPIQFYIGSSTIKSGIATPGSHKDTKTAGRIGYITKFIEEPECASDTIDIWVSGMSLYATEDYATYHWYHNGSLLTTTETNSLTITDTTGYYFVEASDVCGCVYTSDTLFLTTLGIHNSEALSHIGVYPNPADDILYIDVPQYDEYAIRIYNSLGHLVDQATTHQLKTSIDISTYSAGTYVISIYNGTHSATRKFVKK